MLNARDVHPGNMLSASEWNRLASEIERLGHISAEPRIEVLTTSSGMQLRFANTTRWGQITGNSGTAYAWSEVEPNGDGTWTVKSDGYYGTTSSNQAYELNGSTTIPNDTVVRIWQGLGSEWLFIVSDPMSGVSLTAVPVTVNSLTTIGSGYYPGVLMGGSSNILIIDVNFTVLELLNYLGEYNGLQVDDGIWTDPSSLGLSWTNANPYTATSSPWTWLAISTGNPIFTGSSSNWTSIVDGMPCWTPSYAVPTPVWTLGAFPVGTAVNGQLDVYYVQEFIDTALGASGKINTSDQYLGNGVKYADQYASGFDVSGTGGVPSSGNAPSDLITLLEAWRSDSGSDEAQVGRIGFIACDGDVGETGEGAVGANKIVLYDTTEESETPVGAYGTMICNAPSAGDDGDDGCQLVITALAKTGTLSSSNCDVTTTIGSLGGSFSNFGLDITGGYGGGMTRELHYSVNGIPGLTGTYNYDATTSGNITSMTFTGGILTAVTTKP